MDETGTGEGPEHPQRRVNMSQKMMVLEHLKAGKTITQWEATKKYSILRLAPIIFELKQEDWPILSELRPARSGNNYKVYWLDLAQEHPREPCLFDTLTPPAPNPPAAPTDTVDTSATALRPGVFPEFYAPETKPHNVANPGDRCQILKSFREYCATTSGKAVLIDPGWARELLKLNRPNNRPIKKPRLDDYKQAMRDGCFHLTNVGIAFDTEGHLFDGQHRLTACKETGIPFRANVDFDLPPEVFAVIDTKGSVRSNADFGVIAGITENPKTTVAALSILYRRDNGLHHTTSLKGPQVAAAVAAYPDIAPSVTVAHRMRISGPKATFAAVHYLASKIDAALADQVFRDLNSGAALAPDDPVFVARERLMKQYASAANEFRGAGDVRVRVLLSRMFNYRQSGVKLTKYVLEGGDDWPEPRVRKPAAEAAE